MGYVRRELPEFVPAEMEMEICSFQAAQAGAAAQHVVSVCPL